MYLYNRLKNLNKLPPKDQVIFDIGCGNGRSSKPFYDTGYSVKGIDIDTGQIRKAKEVMPHGIFSVERAEEVVVAPNSFIICQQILSFLNSKEAVSNFIKKVSPYSGYLTLFGVKDQLSKEVLTWTREEVDKIMETMGNVFLFEETIGLGIDLKGNSRHTHKYEIFFSTK